MSFTKIIKAGKLEAWSIYKDQLRDEHELKYLFWECTLNCNFFCKHCGSSAGKKVYQNELTKQEILKAFKEIAAKYDPRKIMIAVTGGEPLLRKDLPEIMAGINKLGFPWGIVTNGYLVNEKIVEDLKEAGLSSVVVSIDGIDNIHDDFRNMPGAYDHAIRAVKLFAKANFLKALQITTSVHQGNIDSLEEMYNEFSQTGINSLRLMNIDPIGRAKDNHEILLNKDQFKKLLDFIKAKRKKKNKLEVVYDCAGFLGFDYEGEVRPWFFNCNTGINTASILHNGDIFVCPNVPREKDLIQGNIKTDNFVDVWENKFKVFRDKNRTACSECQKCQYWNYCLGNSFHLWDFKNKKPNFCHYKELN